MWMEYWVLLDPVVRWMPRSMEKARMRLLAKDNHLAMDMKDFLFPEWN